MNPILSLLLKEGVSRLISGELISRLVRHVVAQAIFYGILAVLGLAALVFLYVFLDRLLSSAMDGESAAAVLCGGNLLLIGLVLIGRSLLRPRRRRPVSKSVTSVLTENPNFGAGLELGRGLGKAVRKSAPEIAMGAAVVGLIIGVKPLITGMFRRPERTPRRRNR